MGLFDNDTGMTDRQACAELQKRGIVSVTLEFSGGHDEGGVDQATYYDAQGNKVEFEVPYVYQQYRHVDGKPVTEYKIGPFGGEDQRDPTPEELHLHKIQATINKPVYDRYGSFAGEFYVNGECEWDVLAVKHKMSGNESHETYSDFEQDWS